MNDRKQRIDEFLKFFRDIAKQNPGYKLSSDNIYSHLTNLGVPKSELKRIDSIFSKWISYFRSNSNCEVFVDPGWPYFCQFISRDEIARYRNDHLKVYIPVDASHIQRSAIEIFEFLSKERISHLSKIGSDVRFDDIVVRLINPNDVVKLVNFVTNNRYIQEGLMPANPFTFSINGLPMAVDGRLSYNSTIATMVQIYINDKNERDKLDTVGVADFYKFIENYYNYVFSSAEGLKVLCRDFDIETNERIVNYKNVFDLMLKSSKDTFSFGDYISHYYECSNGEIQNQKLNQIKNIQHSNNQKLYNQPAMSEDEVNNMLLTIINTMTEEYGSQYQNYILSNINHYLINNNVTYITEYKNLRNTVCNSTFRRDILQILRRKQTDFIDYAQNLLRQNSRTTYSTTEKSTILTVQEILQIMSDKYGKVTAINDLEKYIMYGTPKYLTRDFNLRERIINSSFRQDVQGILYKYGLKPSDYIKAVSDIYINCEEIYIEKAIVETYKKYETRYQEGTSKANGLNFTVGSIMRLFETGDYTGFTRDNGARDNLEKNVSVENFIKFVQNEMGIDNISQIEQNKLIMLVKQYVEKVVSINYTKN